LSAGQRFPRGPSRKGPSGNSCVGNKGLTAREIAENPVSGWASRVSPRPFPSSPSRATSGADSTGRSSPRPSENAGATPPDAGPPRPLRQAPGRFSASLPTRRKVAVGGVVLALRAAAVGLTADALADDERTRQHFHQGAQAADETATPFEFGISDKLMSEHGPVKTLGRFAKMLLLGRKVESWGASKSYRRHCLRYAKSLPRKDFANQGLLVQPVEKSPTFPLTG